MIYIVAAWARRDSPLNPYNGKGHQAFNGGDVPDFTNPLVTSEYDYWDHLGYIIDEAKNRGIYVTLVPQWGNMFINDAWDRGLDKMTADVAREYGEWLGYRFRYKHNLIWMLGGDCGDASTNGTLDIHRAQAEGIMKGVKGVDLAYNEESQLWKEVLMTYHGASNSNCRVSQIFDESDKWISIDGCYNCEAETEDNFPALTGGYEMTNPMPVIESEGWGFWSDHQFDAPGYGGVRVYPYMHNLFGGSGFANLDEKLWDFADGWEDVLNLSDRIQWINRTRDIMESVEWYNLIPDNGIVMTNNGSMWGEIVGARSQSTIVVSFPEGGANSAMIDLSSLSTSRVKETWMCTDDDGVEILETDVGSSHVFERPNNQVSSVLKIESIQGVINDTILMIMPDGTKYEIIAKKVVE